MERTPLQGPSVYLKMREWEGAPRQIGRALSFLNHSPFLIPYVGLLRAIDQSLGQRLPRNWGRIAITVAMRS